jgi:predicted phage terminase large subunit-like protein
MAQPDDKLLAAVPTAAKEYQRRVAAYSSLEAYVDAIDFGVKPALHHKLIIDELEALERGDTRKLMLFLPPGSAKSTYANVLFSSWYLGRHPTNNIITVSHTAELAERWGRRVRNLFSSERHALVFKGIGVSPASAAAGRWDTTSGGEYFATGIGGNVTGRRSDLGLIDDPVASREIADSEIHREKHWSWYVYDFETRLKPNARQLIIMTRWHEDDLAGRILARDGDKWRVVKVPMVATATNDPLGRRVGEMLWPDWYTQEMVDSAQRDPRVWTALYQQEPRPATGGEFKRGWIQYYSSVNPKGMNVIMLVDPAGSKTDKSDFTSIWVVGLGEDENYYILDVIRDRLNLTERGEAVFRLHRKWHPMQVRYERYGMMGDIEYLRHEMDRRSYRFSIVEVGGQITKEDRIRRLVPLFERTRMWFPASHAYTDLNGKQRDLVQDFIEEEYLAFPVGRHDDMLDALARIAEPKLDTPWPRKRELTTIPMLSFGTLDPIVGY